MLPGLDVFYVEGNVGSCVLRQVAVLTAVVRSLADEFAYRFIHQECDGC